MSTKAEIHVRPAPAQDEKGRFLAGNSGNGGRRRGARSKLGEEFLEALYADFSEHGAAAIKRVRHEKPDAYLKVIASLLPKEVILEQPLAALTDVQLAQRISQLASALGIRVVDDDERSQTAH